MLQAFLHKNTFGMSDQWFITSARVLRGISSLDLSCAYYGIREKDKYCPMSEGFLLFTLNVVCAHIYYIDPVLSAFKMMRADELSFARAPALCDTKHPKDTLWAEFPALPLVPQGEYQGSKSKSMFINETLKSRYCHNPIYCSADAIGRAGTTFQTQQHDRILP